MEFQIRKKQKKDVSTDQEIQQRLLNWPDSYYRERDPKIRYRMLEEADRQNLTPEDNLIRHKIFKKRYPNFGKKSLSEVDTYLKAWMEMRFEVENGGGFFTKTRKKEALKALNEMGYFDPKSDQEQHLLYQELYHLGLLYISLCQEDKGYNSIVLGFGHLSDDKLIRKIAAEFRDVAAIAPTKVGLVEECSMWTKALSEAFSDIYPDYADMLTQNAG